MKYSLITFGCQMNFADSERISSLLENSGYIKELTPEKADLVVVNMCSVRESAVGRVYGLLPKMKNKKSILTGCFLDKEKNKLEKHFDFVIKIKDFPELFKGNTKLKYSSPPVAYIPIMTGCNNFCSYCVVPYTRGREYSRPAEEIIREAKNFIKNGYKEIWFLGQNVNSYLDCKGRTFPELLKMADKIKGDFWIRFTSSHPKDFTKELIEIIKDSKKITKYLNLPLQSGSDEILRKMNRPYTFSEYKKLVKLIKKEIKGISLSTDIIVGFPKETRKQFQETEKALREINFEMAYISRYSERPGTKASKLKDNVSLKEKKRREKILTEIIKENSSLRNKKELGKELIVLITSEQKGFYFGKTENYKTVKVHSPKNVLNKFVKVKITETSPWKLTGKLSSS